MARRTEPPMTPDTQATTPARQGHRLQARELQKMADLGTRAWRPTLEVAVQPPMPGGNDKRCAVVPPVQPAGDPRPAAATRVLKTFSPGAPGAVKLTRRYGPALICVRYRLDATGTVRYTTVELLIEQAPIQHRAATENMVTVKFLYAEANLRNQAWKLGAKWDAKTKLWRMSKATSKALGLDSRITKPSHR